MNMTMMMKRFKYGYTITVLKFPSSFLAIRTPKFCLDIARMKTSFANYLIRKVRSICVFPDNC